MSFECKVVLVLFETVLIIISFQSGAEVDRLCLNIKNVEYGMQ